MARGNGLDPKHQKPLPWFQKLLFGAIAVLLGLLISVVVFSLIHGKEKIHSVASISHPRVRHRLSGVGVSKTDASALPPASAGANGASAHPRVPASGSSVLMPGARASFSALEGSLPAQIGVAVAPLGSSRPLELGQLQIGHAWSSFKVPILVTLMSQQGTLSPEEDSRQRQP